MRHLITISLLFTLIFSKNLLASPINSITPLQDMTEYAMASCLYHQKSEYLQEEGNAWASIIINRMHGAIDVLTEINQAVLKASEQQKPFVVSSETSPTHDRVVYIPYCYEMASTPVVKSAIDQAAKAISKDYPQP
ncbi:hypothetical protein ACKC9G_12400 [Pokkaliibacter sp. CJK22405]|uniref:hypothetical protein n=1 Tax=Pokkaliibacter sp. CJK22405 TaxID=3384615 RepID=UPI0039853F2E